MVDTWEMFLSHKINVFLRPFSFFIRNQPCKRAKNIKLTIANIYIYVFNVGLRMLNERL